MNINDFKRLYRRIVEKPGDSSGIVYLELDRVKVGNFRKLTHVTVEDRTNACTKFRLFIRHAHRLHYLDELSAPAAAELGVEARDIVMGEQDIFGVEITGSTDGDELVLCAIGWEGPIR